MRRKISEIMADMDKLHKVKLTDEQIDELNKALCDLSVTYKNNTIYLSRDLLYKQDAWKNLKKIKTVHKCKLMILDAMESMEDIQDLRFAANELKGIEFKLQELWGFPKDARWHKFWEVSHCLCPKMDNNDWYPTGRCFISGNCPVHGGKYEI